MMIDEQDLWTDDGRWMKRNDNGLMVDAMGLIDDRMIEGVDQLDKDDDGLTDRL
jgi:hypothetical protein